MFGGEQPVSEEERKNAEEKKFDLLKYDGVKALRTRQADYAERYFREALKLKEDLEVRDYLSQALLQQGNLEGALAELKIIAAAVPEQLSVLSQAAHVAYMLEDYAEMKALCEQALTVDGDDAMANYQMAQAVMGQGDMVSGIARLTKAIAVDERLGDARLLRAKTLVAMGDLKGADEDVKWLMEKVQPNEDVVLMAARVQTAQGNVDEAIMLYGQVIDLNPFNIDAYRERGQLKYDQGDKQGAEEDMQKVLELNPDAMSNVSGDYQAEGIEQKIMRRYSNLNPLGI